ncbi:MAG: 3-phosphoglycerate dehydrogenase [Gammaproteobacteria bacterium]|nr:MAG: 3-phosphoglycerate dehydrogenase [Gammaproteobacteria bacterium]|tara:strand:- start:7049 stop:8224 length:1176 start_codon:yes stop_codon:yes gene_type:complete
MRKIKIINNISNAGLERFNTNEYELVDDAKDPSAIILRSFQLKSDDIPLSVDAIGRAGAGVNNIPIELMTDRGVPVFNAPGANANAVKELTIASLLIAARNICSARDYVRSLNLDDNDIKQSIESGKKQFAGIELPGRTLGVIGLGSIGVNVANAALDLGMKVIGFDPKVTVNNAWQLSSGVQKVESINEIFQKSNAVSVHVPLVNETKNLVNKENLILLNKYSILINFSRAGIVNTDDVIDALDKDILSSYVCDFPEPRFLKNEKIIALPHLGASTREAEENCAIMVIENIKDFLENGNINYSVNFPKASMTRNSAYRLTIANKNIPNMVGQITSILANEKLNIEDLLNKSSGNIAYTIVDLDRAIPDEAIKQILSIDGVLRVRYLGASV